MSPPLFLNEEFMLFNLLISYQIKSFYVGGIYNAMGVKKKGHKNLGRKSDRKIPLRRQNPREDENVKI